MKLLNMKRCHNINLTFFSGFTIFWFVHTFIMHTFALYQRGIGSVGPYNLNEISWSIDTIEAIIAGVIFTMIASLFEKNKVKTVFNKKNTNMLPKRKYIFKNVYIAILTYTSLFMTFILLIAYREYRLRDLEVTLLQFCRTEIPWIDIIWTSLVLGIIMSMGFYRSSEEE